MREYPLRSLTAEVAHSTVMFVLKLPRNMVMMELGRQLLRAGTGVGANYRAAHRAQSDPDLLTKLKKVEEESDESMFWLEQILLVGLNPPLKLSAKHLHSRCDEVTALVVTAIKTVRGRIAAKRKR
jgi:four helix bundle protein